MTLVRFSTPALETMIGLLIEQTKDETTVLGADGHTYTVPSHTTKVEYSTGVS